MLVDLVPSGWTESHAPDGRLQLELWVPQRDRARAASELRAALTAAGVAAEVRDATETDEWVDGLRRHHVPIEVRGRVRVRPPWAEPVAGPIDIVIDPGMAFGTGQHATTRGCLHLLLDLPTGSVLDVGTGSGVLAIAAAKLGHSPVHAIDNDPLAVEATGRNAAANGVELRVAGADGTADVLPVADIVLANITRLHVAALAAHLPEPLPRHAVLSGFVTEDVASATGPWLERGYRQVSAVTEGEWAATLLELDR